MDQLDLRILKAITEHTGIALDFSYRYGPKFFEVESRAVAKPIIDYVKAYKSKPTRRALSEKHENEPEISKQINDFWDLIESTEHYDDSDYQFDLDNLKKRYGQKKYSELRSAVSNVEDPENPLEAVKLIEKTINEIKTVNSSFVYTRKTLKDNLSDFTQQYIAKSKDPELGRGILTGYSYLDYIKNGLRSSDLVVIAGETGCGKSMWLNNMAIKTWMQGNTLDTNVDDFNKGYNVVYFSLEMPWDDCFQRTMAAMADVPSYHIRDAKLSKAEAHAVKKSCEFIKNYPYTFDIIDVPRGLTCEDLELHFESIKADYNPDVVFIDYLGLMNDFSNEDDWLKLGLLAGKVHEFARTYEVPVVTAVQLNRLNAGDIKKKEENEAKRIGLHRIGRSALIATHATLIMQIDKRPNEENLGDFKYHILKNRHGESGGSHSIIKNFSHCIIKDEPYNVELQTSYTSTYDISEDVSDILEELKQEL